MIQLYNKAECPFCLKVRIALAEADIDYELITLGADDDRAILKHLSPSGTMPILKVAELAIWESAVIVEFINDMAADKLLPATPEQQAKARLLHAYSDNQVGTQLREVIFAKRDIPEAEWDWQRINAGEAGWRQCLDWLEQQLAEEDYFAQQFSIAECALYPRFSLAEKYGVGVDEQHPRLQHWYDRIKQRASCSKL